MNVRNCMACVLILMGSFLATPIASGGGSSDILFVPDSDVWVIASDIPEESYLLLNPFVLKLVWDGVRKDGFQYLSTGDIRYLIYWDEEDCSLVGFDGVSHRYWVISK